MELARHPDRAVARQVRRGSCVHGHHGGGSIHLLVPRVERHHVPGGGHAPIRSAGHRDDAGAAGAQASQRLLKQALHRAFPGLPLEASKRLAPVPDFKSKGRPLLLPRAAVPRPRLRPPRGRPAGEALQHLRLLHGPGQQGPHGLPPRPVLPQAPGRRRALRASLRTPGRRHAASPAARPGRRQGAPLGSSAAAREARAGPPV
mmetsp:Transcript_5922/g.16758  ORF Transcript_5922/g.16758 Transcript_5922/m.16758 type:complete len:203 (+) Transcript_5922:501-1109(+)